MSARMLRFHADELWRNSAFLKLWTGETISAFGSQITALALPLVAVSTLHASPFAMGVLSALSTLPILLFGLPAGVWVDRQERRPILLSTNLGRAVALGTIPLAALLGFLVMPLLFIVAFVTGTLSVLFDTAYQSYLPSLVPRDALVQGNSRFEASRSTAQVAGPAIAGFLVTALTAPLTIALDALSFVLSAVSISLIRVPRVERTDQGERRHLLKDMTVGLRFVATHSLLRILVGITCISNLWSGAIFSQRILFMKAVLGLSPALIGILLSVGGPSALLGVLITGRLSRRLGIGRTIIFGSILFTVGDFCLGLAAGPLPLVIVLAALFHALVGIGSPLYNITAISLRQALTPDHLLGRVVASARVVAVGSLPLGALIGGALSELIGPRALLLTASAGMLIPLAWLILSPLASLRTPPSAD